MSWRKLAQITAIHANPNYDQKEVNKEQILQDMENKFNQALETLYEDTQEVKKRMEEDPFLAAGKRGLEWTKDHETGQSSVPENGLVVPIEVDQS